MKLIIISILALLVSACTSNGKEQSDLCALNINQINGYNAMDTTTMGEPNKSRVNELGTQAEAYQKQGDMKNCIAVSEQALSILKQHNSK